MGCLGIQNRGDKNKKKTKKARERERDKGKRKRTNKQMNNGVLNKENMMSGPEPRAWVCVDDEDNE